MMRRQVAVMEKVNQGDSAFKIYLAVVVLLLSQGDFVGAERAYQEFLQYVSVPIAPPATQCQLSSCL